MQIAGWNASLAASVPWQPAYETVAREARALLDTFGTDRSVTTTELVELLYPEHIARGDGILARKRIFKALAALSTRGLSHYCTRGAARKLRHSSKVVRPWVWHAPAEGPHEEAKGQSCPHCGGELAA